MRTRKQLKKEIKSIIKKGFRHAYHYRPEGTLNDAITFRFLTTCETAARQKAESTLFSGKKEIKVWDLQEELLNLSKTKEK